MFVNEQVTGKSWSVTAKNKVKMSVITNVVVLKLEDHGDSHSNQKFEHLMTGKWQISKGNENVIVDL